MKTVFIDGSAGTTGLKIHDRLSERKDIKLNILPEKKRKDPTARYEALRDADIAFLCLPDEAAIEAANWCAEEDTVIIDTSTAHRTTPGWVYGFPELATGDELASTIRSSPEATGPMASVAPGGRMHKAISHAKRIANPGCHATGFIALISPLVQTGLLKRDAQLTCISMTGYTGGGKSMIEDYENNDYPSPRVYGLAQAHKHLPEMQMLTGLKRAPIMVPVVADYEQGMEVTVPLFADQLDLECPFLKHAGIVGAGSKPTVIDAVSAIYWQAYRGPVVRYEEHPDESGFMAADKLAWRDGMEISVKGNEERILLIARFDNLGKGACGAAIQNMNLVLGCDETEGLQLS